MRRRSSVDANQAEIVAAVRKAGATWLNLSAVGHGCPDGILGARGYSWLVEIKTADGTLTEDQIKFAGEWRGSPVHIVRSVDDALAILRTRPRMPECLR